MTEKLKELYQDPSFPGSFSGLETFFHALKSNNVNVTKKDLKKWLRSQEAYMMHIHKKFKRIKIISGGVDIWLSSIIDLVDMRKHSRKNNGVKYLMYALMFSVNLHG